MHFDKITLLTADLDQQEAFYRDVLSMPVERAEFKLLVHAGTTQLEFQQATEDWKGAYHFAFEIPENQFTEAYDWVSKRVELIPGEDGNAVIAHDTWNAHGLYFFDAGRNVVEWIARHDEDNATDDAFSPASILRVSEIGIPSEDVQDAAGLVQRHLEVDIYDGEGSETFSALGSREGLLILVSLARVWYPNTGVPATYSPIEIELTLDDGERYHFNAPPYPGVISRASY